MFPIKIYCKRLLKTSDVNRLAASMVDFGLAWLTAERPGQPMDNLKVLKFNTSIAIAILVHSRYI
jgi:hypothetical protein